MSTVIRGLTWDHPRATRPLAAANSLLNGTHPGVELTWDVQTLEGFGHSHMADLMARFDFMVFDHPHIGEIVAQGLLRPVDDLMAGLGPDDYVGPSLASYRMRGQTWALPIDAACQVACYRPDLLERLVAEPPRTWDGLLKLGAAAAAMDLKLAIAFGDVHALMTLFSLCANEGAPVSATRDGVFPDRSQAVRAIEALRELLRYCPAEALEWNSIELQEQMVSRDDLVFCPAVYGFATYSHHASPRRLEYADMVSLENGEPLGSTIGGAGLGISALRPQTPEALAIARWLVEPDVQTAVIGMNFGQPAAAAAWECDMVNEEFGEFYRKTRKSIENAWVRPRDVAFPEFQHRAGRIVDKYLRGSAGTAEMTIAALDGCWRELTASLTSTRREFG